MKNRMEDTAPLKEVMQREITILRELLGNLQQEQQALLTNRTDEVRARVAEREYIIQSMASAREQRIALIGQLAGSPGELSADQAMEVLEEAASEENIELLSMRDQLVALLKQLSEMTERNNVLLEGKIDFTQQMLEQLCPPSPHPTYGAKGEVKPRVKTALVTLVNREV